MRSSWMPSQRLRNSGSMSGKASSNLAFWVVSSISSRSLTKRLAELSIRMSKLWTSCTMGSILKMRSSSEAVRSSATRTSFSGSSAE